MLRSAQFERAMGFFRQLADSDDWHLTAPLYG